MEPIPKRVLYFKVEEPVPAFAEACLSLTPKVSVVDGREIFLEISTTAHLFGGEDGMVFLARNLAETFREKPIVLLLDRAEWARSCAVLPELLIPPGGDAAYLQSLAIERLESIGDPRISGEELAERGSLIAFMRRSGMRTIGDFARLSYISVGRRFGKAGVALQEWVGGVRELALPDFVPDAPIRETLSLLNLSTLDSRLSALRSMLVRIENRLLGRAAVAREMKLTFTLASGDRLEKIIDLPQGEREEGPLLKSLRELLSGIRWETPFLRLDLEVTRLESFVAGRISRDLAGYVERLRTRFGCEAVGFPALTRAGDLRPNPCVRLR